MKRYSKPLGRLLDFKQDFFMANDRKLSEFHKIAQFYISQPPREACKNCACQLESGETASFTKLGVKYIFCRRCGHCNGAHEDTDEFCRFLYTDSRGGNYSKNYTAADADEYRRRVEEIYVPKAEFLKAALKEQGQAPEHLCDFGAGAGHFVSAARSSGFSSVKGYEPSEMLAEFGNSMEGEGSILLHGLDDLVSIIEAASARIASFVGVIEHLRNPRSVMEALRDNPNIQYVFFSVPMFSPTVVMETVFEKIMPRHLVAGHTHLFTEQSIDHFCSEFGFERLSEWWFGLDIVDLCRSVQISLQKLENPSVPLQRYWAESFYPLVDRLQAVLDEAHMCSEVHMLIGKKK